jgi:hypothetical protein
MLRKVNLTAILITRCNLADGKAFALLNLARLQDCSKGIPAIFNAEVFLRANWRKS